MSGRYVGIDIGAETIKVVELRRNGKGMVRVRREIVEHHKEPSQVLVELLGGWDWDGVTSAAVSGRFSRLLRLPRVPTKQAQSGGLSLLDGVTGGPVTLVSIGGHGFSVLERRQSGVEIFRENSRCSQGTGNFLRQLVARFDLSIEQASEMCEAVEDPAPLSGRCPVILKTDMTHLANKGECRGRILAGLYDAVCENVQVLIKPRLSPPRVMLAGGVARSRRIRNNFAAFLSRHGMELLPVAAEDALFVEALGCALLAVQRAEQRDDRAGRPIPSLEQLLAPVETMHLDRVPALYGFLPQVKRLKAAPPAPRPGAAHRLILGFDIGSTGSKAVALDADRRQVIWEGYLNTNGNPVGAAQSLMQRFVDGPAGRFPVLALGATGSGREIVGSLLSTCYGVERVYVLNEIAAHAEGALHFDPEVDTIFEIGGQDAKYIRLADGRVVDAAMNEACSAGTGSFIEEQGRKFSGIEDVIQLGEEALRSDCGISLGQHCSVFMAEIIDEAVAAGSETRSIIAGIYDSIIQNYLNRVKGSRSVGQVIFCQGMPFSADALAAAVVRQTGSRVVVPPNPGTVGALGIGLLTRKGIETGALAPLDPQRFLAARVAQKDTFVCKSTKGCGGTGNCCRIDRLTTVVEDRRQRFTWGGGCSLWDRGTGKRKLPDRSPDPFRQRQQLVAEVIERTAQAEGKRVALTDEFQIKGLLPFFATFIAELGFRPVVETGADHAILKRGIERANVPFCAPMQQFHGLVSKMAEQPAELLFLPMMREITRVADERRAVLCPIVQGSADMLRWDLEPAVREKILSPVIDFGEGNLQSRAFLESCARMAAQMGVIGERWWRAHQAAAAVQADFDARCRAIGREALAFCREREIVPVVVLGRAYTIYNTVLNSNVPALLREQGAIALPIDCYEIAAQTPVFHDIYWGYGQRNLRAAHQIRRTRGLYSLWCSNYSCGPDSFNLHFYSYIMEGKPFAIIETDGHSGDAGTKTRIEAFLHCVREDWPGRAAPPTTDAAQLIEGIDRPAAAIDAASSEGRAARAPNLLKRIELDKEGLPEIRRKGERVLIPRMGVGAESLAACLRGIGVPAEALPQPDRETVQVGRRFTSGKECVPMCITLGSLLQRIEQDRDGDERFAFFMPTACGPCRFGVYNVLHKIVLERLGWKDRVRVWSPIDADYFRGLPPGFGGLVFTGFVAVDMLLEALYDVRPVERREGAAREIWQRYHRQVISALEQAGRGDLSVRNTLMQLVNGRHFGTAEVLRRAAVELSTVKRRDARRPTVAMVGEIYVRCDPFANDFVVDKLERHGIHVRFAPFSEWLEYTDLISRREGTKRGFGAQLSSFVQRRIQERLYATMADILGWPARTRVRDSLAAAAPYVRPELTGEAVLTLGGPLHEWREGQIDGVISVGPLECMPNKIAEAQFFHVAEQEGLASLTLALNGDPVDPEVIDAFAFEVKSRFHRRQERKARDVPSLSQHGK